MKNAILNYRNAHKNPANRALHVLGLPLIIFSLAVGAQQIQVGSYITVADVLCIVYVRNYYEHDSSTLLPMALFFGTVNYLARWHAPSAILCLLLHALGWAMQLFGHRYFEGNRPALLTSIEDSVSAAPLLLYYELKETGSHMSRVVCDRSSSSSR